MIEITIFYIWVVIMGIVASMVIWGILEITVFALVRDIIECWNNRPIIRYRQRVMEHLNQLLEKRGNHV